MFALLGVEPSFTPKSVQAFSCCDAEQLWEECSPVLCGRDTLSRENPSILVEALSPRAGGTVLH